jgi:two-component system sensor histidine kinase KdpD
MASRIKADLHVVHIESGDSVATSKHGQLELLRQLASDLGATWTELHADDPAKALMDVARERQITQIVVGSSQRSRWQEVRGGGSVIRKLSRLASDAGIDIHIIARRTVPAEPDVPPDWGGDPFPSEGG